MSQHRYQPETADRIRTQYLNLLRTMDRSHIVDELERLCQYVNDGGSHRDRVGRGSLLAGDLNYRFIRLQSAWYEADDAHGEPVPYPEEATDGR
jgi:hypothetical protein